MTRSRGCALDAHRAACEACPACGQMQQPAHPCLAAGRAACSAASDDSSAGRPRGNISHPVPTTRALASHLLFEQESSGSGENVSFADDDSSGSDAEAAYGGGAAHLAALQYEHEHRRQLVQDREAMRTQPQRPSPPVRRGEGLQQQQRPPQVFLQLGQEKRIAFFRLGDFVTVRALGTGTFGRVFLVKYTASPKYFALKKLRKVDIYRLKQVDHVQSERSLLARLSHPFIIRLHAAMQDERHLYMLLEYAPGGELFHYLRRAGRFSVGATRFYIAELVLAIEYLHAHGIVYRDLKPENLLLDAGGHLKLADFGFAKVVPAATYTLCGTPEYLAPEIIRGHGYGRSVDWWALGVLIYEMVTGNPPFNGNTPTAVYEQALSGTVQFLPTVPPDVRELVSGLLTIDITKRLGCTDGGAATVKAAPFFGGVDWAAVYERAYRPPILPATHASPPGTPAGGAYDDEAAAECNFPLDDSQSSMDVHIENEGAILQSHDHISFTGFTPDDGSPSPSISRGLHHATVR